MASLASEKQTSTHAILMMVAAHFCFTLMMVFIKSAHQTETLLFPVGSVFGTWEAVLFRSVPMAIVCLILVIRQNKHSRILIPMRSLPWLFIRGFIGAISMACLFYGSIHVPLAVTSLFSNSNVFIIGILAHFFLNERMTWVRGICTLCGFLGVVLVLSDGLIYKSQSIHVTSRFALLVAFSSGFFSAVAYFSIRKMKDISGSLLILSLAIAGSLLACVGFAFEGFHMPQSKTGFCLLLASAIPALLGQFLMTWSFQNAEAGLVSTGQYAGPVFAALFGSLVFSEKFSVLQVTGTILALFFGVLLPILQQQMLTYD